MKRFSTVFSFTFRRQTGTKGWRTATILLALLLFLLPALLPTLVDQFSDEDEPLQCSAARLLVVDQTPGAADWSMLNQMGSLQFEYVLCGDVETAAVQAGEDGLIAVLTDSGNGYALTVLRPDDSPLTKDDAEDCAAFLESAFGLIRLQKSGVTSEQAAGLAVPVTVDYADAEAAAAAEQESIMEILNMALPYLSLMLVYFMVLFYGQSVANSAVSEKSSKLMDTFLVSVPPEAMMLGKTLAIALAAIVQLSIWLASLIGGCVVGTALLWIVNPVGSSAVMTSVESVGSIEGLFTPAGIVVAAAIMLGGFLLYCALAAVGGAMASKQEELASTNVLFTMALIISFFVCIYGGVMRSSAVAAAWVDWVPFTAILATPARVLLGQITPLAGLLSLALILICAVLVCLLAGRVYRMMSFYRGAPPTPKRMLEMLRSK